MQIQDSDFYFDYSAIPDANPWTQAGFSMEAGHVAYVSGGALAGDSGSGTNTVTWSYGSHPAMTKGEVFAKNGLLAGSSGDFMVGVLDSSGNGYFVQNNGNVRFRAYKSTAGVLSQIGSPVQFRRQYAPGDTFSLRFEIVAGGMVLEFCLNGNAFISHTDDSSPHLSDLRPCWRLSNVAKISAIGVHKKVIRPTYEEHVFGLDTPSYAEGTIKDNITRAATFAEYEITNDLPSASWLPVYGDCVTEVAVAARSPDGSTVNIATDLYRLNAGVPDIRVTSFLNILVTGLASTWVTRVLSPLQDISNAVGGEVVLGAAQVVGDSATGFVRMGVADGYSAAGVRPSPFGVATPYSLIPNVPNSPNVRVTVRRQVWPSNTDDTVFKIDSLKIPAEKILSKKISAQKL